MGSATVAMTVTSMSKLKAFGYRVWILLTRLKKIQNYFALAGMSSICDILYYEYHVEACYEEAVCSLFIKEALLSCKRSLC